MNHLTPEVIAALTARQYVDGYFVLLGSDSFSLLNDGITAYPVLWELGDAAKKAGLLLYEDNGVWRFRGPEPPTPAASPKSPHILLLERLANIFTPGGSEFAHNEQAILQFAEDRLKRAEDRHTNVCVERNQLREKLRETEAKLADRDERIAAVIAESARIGAEHDARMVEYNKQMAALDASLADLPRFLNKNTN